MDKLVSLKFTNCVYGTISYIAASLNHQKLFHRALSSCIQDGQNTSENNAINKHKINEESVPILLHIPKNIK